MGRIESLAAETGGVAELVGPATAWRAAELVTAGFAPPGGARPLLQAVNWTRLRFVTRAVINRDRTAVIGVGGARPGPLVVAALAGAWVAPRLPRPVLLAGVGATIAAALRDGRLARVVWTMRTLRRVAPHAIVLGEFAAREPGAGVAFAAQVLETIGDRVAFAITVQGPADDRRVRSLLRLYERRLQFEVAARHEVAGSSVVLMVRPPGAVRRAASPAA